VHFELTHVQSAETGSCRVSRWLKQEGDWVEKDEPLLELEVDKVEIETESPVSGTLKEIGAEAGDELFDGDLIAVFEVKEAS
jgi:pyruvate dehydrogenase E2 component (dihydrolipoamide acetyltransferase)